MSFLCAVVLAVAIGSDSAPLETHATQAPAKPVPPAAPSGPIAPPAFDGNVAALEWGGRVESITGVKPNDGTMRHLISEVSSGLRTTDKPGVKEVVISFFRHEPVLVGSVHVIGSTFPTSAKDLEIWTSPTSADTGWVKATDGVVPPPPSAFKSPEQTFTFAPVEARFVKLRFLHNHQPAPRDQGEIRILNIRVFEANQPGYVPLLTRRPEIAVPGLHRRLFVRRTGRTGGLSYTAKDGVALGDALLAATTEKFPYTVYNQAGKAVLSSEAGTGSGEIAPGDYKVVAKAGTKDIVAPRVKVTLGKTTTLKLGMKNGQLVLE